MAKPTYEEMRQKRLEENKKRMEDLKLTHLAQTLKNAIPKPSQIKKQKIPKNNYMRPNPNDPPPKKRGHPRGHPPKPPKVIFPPGHVTSPPRSRPPTRKVPFPPARVPSPPKPPKVPFLPGHVPSAPRPRGRPPKPKDPTKTTTTGPPRPRGRPPKTLAQDKNPAIARDASKAINELKKQWEIEEGETWRFTTNQKQVGDIDGEEADGGV